MELDLFLFAFAFTAGLLTFFSPCSVALIPAYVGYYAATGEGRAAGVSAAGRWAAVRSGSWFATAACIGILAVLAMAALFVIGGRAVFGVRSEQLGVGAVWLGVSVGVLLVLLGVLLLLERGPRFSVPLRAPSEKSFMGMMGFGVVFALGSVGCTLPLFLALSFQALNAPLAIGVAAFAIFGFAVVGLFFALSIGVSLAKEQVVARLRRVMPHVKMLSGVLLLLAGAYVALYYAFVFRL